VFRADSRQCQDGNPKRLRARLCHTLGANDEMTPPMGIDPIIHARCRPVAAFDSAAHTSGNNNDPQPHPAIAQLSKSELACDAVSLASQAARPSAVAVGTRGAPWRPARGARGQLGRWAPFPLTLAGLPTRQIAQHCSGRRIQGVYMQITVIRRSAVDK
jgi:hypothetical protein